MECGSTLFHTHKRMSSKTQSISGVSYCCNPTHHHMVNRDVDAAQKIAYRFLCQLAGKPLGPWGYDSSLEKKTDEPTKTTTTTTTKTALKDFIDEFFPADLWYGRHHGVPA